MLDAELPGLPKSLLTGLAEGADTIAAELALGRADWRAEAVLPLARGVYADDFTGASRDDLDALLIHPRVTVRELATLSGPAARDMHYEQLGLWLASHAALLIAVKPASERPGLLGGTARTLAYRLSGQLDAAAQAIVAASTELPAAAEFPGAPAWLIDAPREPGSPSRRRPFAVLLPGDAPGAPARHTARRLALSLRSTASSPPTRKP